MLGESLLTWLDSIVWIDWFSNWLRLRLIFTLVGSTLQFGISFMVNDTLPVALHIEWRYISLTRSPLAYLIYQYGPDGPFPFLCASPWA